MSAPRPAAREPRAAAESGPAGEPEAGAPPPRQCLPLVRVTGVLLRQIYRLFGGYRVEGLEHVPARGPAILAPNHLSWADPPALRAAIRRRCWFMANHDLFERPILGRLIPLYGAFPVHRGTIDRRALQRAERHLRDGDLVVIFPEGGTTITGTLYPFEGGVALLSLRTGAPIVPVGITGTDRLWPTDRRWPRFARGGATLRFGPPLRPESVDPALPRRQRVEELTRRLYDAVAALLPDEYLPEDYRRRRASASLPFSPTEPR